MGAYYNEFDRYPAQWLRNLSERNYIAPGVVDDRSIKSVAPEDVRGAQAHFFAGIGVWSYALRLAGWPDDFPVWTGSCPCQPFSEAGRGKGLDDERHLWPDWYGLIKKRRPHCLFGEQSASPRGRKWLDLVCADLEAIGYAVGTLITCSAGVGAPHQRHRLYFMAHSEEFRWPEGWNARPRTRLDEAWEQFERFGDAGELADAYRSRFAGQPGSGSVSPAEAEVAAWLDGADRAQHGGAARELADPYGGSYERAFSGSGGPRDRTQASRSERSVGGPASNRKPERVADSDSERLEGQRLHLRERGPGEDLLEAPWGGEARELVDAAGGGRGQGGLHERGHRAADGTRAPTQQRDAGSAHRVADAAGGRLEAQLGHVPSRQSDDGRRGEARGVGDAGSARGGWNSGAVPPTQAEGARPGFATGRLAHLPLLAGSTGFLGDAQRAGLQEQLRYGGVLREAGLADPGQAAGRAGSPLGGLWTDAVWLYCRDELYRPTESRVVTLADGTASAVDFLRPLAKGVQGRVGKIKGFGNAINALQAATFIRAAMECTRHL